MAFLNYNNRTICYRLLGDCEKPLLVLAHPLGMTQGVWDDMLPTLLERFRVLTWDLPGHSSSAAWPQSAGDITPEDLAPGAPGVLVMVSIVTNLMISIISDVM